MNDFSALPAAANDSRLSSPEAVAPNAPNPVLQARRQKLRRIVAWVVGGATLLMCAGLVRAAIRAHSEPESASTNTAAFVAAPPPVAVATPTAPDPPAPLANAVPAPSASAVATEPPKLVKKVGVHAKAAAKPAKRTTIAKSIRH